jgi:hypothetical protein
VGAAAAGDLSRGKVGARERGGGAGWRVSVFFVVEREGALSLSLEFQGKKPKTKTERLTSGNR